MRHLFFAGLTLMAVGLGAQSLDGLFNALEVDGDSRLDGKVAVNSTAADALDVAGGIEVGGDFTWNGAFLDKPNTGAASDRTFFRGDGTWAGVGLQDAAHAILTADASTMSSTYTTMMSATVTVGDASDAVRVDVTALLGLMVGALYVVDNSGDELWQMEGPENPALATNQGSFPSGLTSPQGITSYGGALYVVDINPGEMWRCADPTSPGTCVNQGSFPAGLAAARGITSHSGAVYVVDINPGELWRCADPTSPGTCVNQGSFPAGLADAQGITSYGGALYVVDINPGEMWRCADPTSPGTCVNQGSFPAGLAAARGITSYGGAVYVADNSGEELWRCADPTSPGTCVKQGNFPSGLTQPGGITSIGDGPCDIRLARGSTAVETITLTEGRILLDASFTDAPGAGTHTYALQMKTSDPDALCTVYRGQGETPLPALFVQAFYGGA